MGEKGERVAGNTLGRRLYGCVRESGIEKRDLKPRDLRRAFGTWFPRANPGHVGELAELMEHSVFGQVMTYALFEER